MKFVVGGGVFGGRCKYLVVHCGSVGYMVVVDGTFSGHWKCIRSSLEVYSVVIGSVFDGHWKCIRWSLRSQKTYVCFLCFARGVLVVGGGTLGDCWKCILWSLKVYSVIVGCVHYLVVGGGLDDYWKLIRWSLDVYSTRWSVGVRRWLLEVYSVVGGVRYSTSLAQAGVQCIVRVL